MMSGWKGVGMMAMLNQTPIDYLIWGNHEHDMPHADMMRREREYNGVGSTLYITQLTETLFV